MLPVEFNPRNYDSPRVLGVGKCVVRHCGRDHYADGLCMRHYMHRRLRGLMRPDLEREELTKDVKICRALFCRRDAVMKGVCRKHATQLRVHGRLTPERELGAERTCTVRHCGGEHVAHGLCMRHYNKRRRNPSTLESLRESIHGYGSEWASKFDDFYPQSASGELRPHKTEKLYKGQKVHWIGQSGHMVKVTPDYVKNLEGNVFDPEKLAAVAWFIRRSPEPVVMRPGYGQVVASTSIDDIAESLQYAKDAALFGEDRTLSTGDESLDSYLKDPETYLDDNLGYYSGPGSESEDEDVAKAGFRTEMEEMKAEAIREGWGDLGERRFTVLDGNHRTFGALLAGEPYAWIRLLENDYQDWKRGGRPDLDGVLE